MKFGEFACSSLLGLIIVCFGMTGMYKDPFTGHYHTHFRDYDPITCRWNMEDPAGYADGLNLYGAYMGVNGRDPLGLQRRGGRSNDRGMGNPLAGIFNWGARRSITALTNVLKRLEKAINQMRSQNGLPSKTFHGVNSMNSNPSTSALRRQAEHLRELIKQAEAELFLLHQNPNQMPPQSLIQAYVNSGPSFALPGNAGTRQFLGATRVAHRPVGSNGSFKLYMGSSAPAPTPKIDSLASQAMLHNSVCPVVNGHVKRSTIPYPSFIIPAPNKTATMPGLISPIRNGFQNRPDPIRSIDTREIKNPIGYSQAGFPRDNIAFWKLWIQRYPATMSRSNRMLVNGINPQTGKSQRPVSPVINETWLNFYPHHRPYKNQTLIHHHSTWINPKTGVFKEGPFAFPVPLGTHRGHDAHWHAPSQ